VNPRPAPLVTSAPVSMVAQAGSGTAEAVEVAETAVPPSVLEVGGIIGERTAPEGIELRVAPAVDQDVNVLAAPEVNLPPTVPACGDETEVPVAVEETLPPVPQVGVGKLEVTVAPEASDQPQEVTDIESPSPRVMTLLPLGPSRSSVWRGQRSQRPWCPGRLPWRP
jgi:hypothetical protein